MEVLLAKVTQQAMNYAIRSGITITSTYAISQCSRLLKTSDSQRNEELADLQRRLESKIRIVSPAIDMIDLITARGNTSLESAVNLTKSLRWDIQSLGVRLSQAAADEEKLQSKKSKLKHQAQRESEIRAIVSDMKKLLERIEDAVPLISLAITTSGVSLSTNLPATISPSRLLQASTFLSAGDAQYATSSNTTSQVGPTFTLSVYMLFQGHAHQTEIEDGFKSTIWQEVIHKARVKLLRTTLSMVEELPQPSASTDNRSENTAYEHHDDYLPQTIPAERRFDEFAYQLLLIEDLDDDRVHTFDEGEQPPCRFEDVPMAGIREIIPIHQVSRIFYADTGKILNIGTEGEPNNPLLLLRRDINAIPPRRMMKNEDEGHSLSGEGIEKAHSPLKYSGNEEDSELEAQFARDSSFPPEAENSDLQPVAKQWRFSAGLDPEWVALEVYDETLDSGSESDEERDFHFTNHDNSLQRHQMHEPELSSALSRLRLNSEPINLPPHASRNETPKPSTRHVPAIVSASRSLQLGQAVPVRTSLSLLEMLIRLTSLQQFQQSSHLTINDELLNFFLDESSTTGAARGDVETRKRIRMEARQRVGFDPYDESPIKRRGEEYQYRGDAHDSGYEGQWSKSPRPDGWQAHRDGSSPLRGYTPMSPALSQSATPLRQVVQKNMNRNLVTPPSLTGSQSRHAIATPAGSVKEASPQLWHTPSPRNHELTATHTSRDTPLLSVEVDDDQNLSNPVKF